MYSQNTHCLPATRGLNHHGNALANASAASRVDFTSILERCLCWQADEAVSKKTEVSSSDDEEGPGLDDNALEAQELEALLLEAAGGGSPPKSATRKRGALLQGFEQYLSERGFGRGRVQASMTRTPL